jgi:hypothetical protein
VTFCSKAGLSAHPQVPAAQTAAATLVRSTAAERTAISINPMCGRLSEQSHPDAKKAEWDGLQDIAWSNRKSLCISTDLLVSTALIVTLTDLQGYASRSVRLFLVT